MCHRNVVRVGSSLDPIPPPIRFEFPSPQTFCVADLANRVARERGGTMRGDVLVTSRVSSRRGVSGSVVCAAGAREVSSTSPFFSDLVVLV